MADEGKAKRINLICVTRGCEKSKQTHPNIRFFPLPQAGEKRRKWLHAVGRDDLINNKHITNEILLLCSYHFESEIINSVKTLNTNAEPTMNIPTFNELDTSHPSSSTIVDESPLPTEMTSDTTAYLGPQLSPTSIKCTIKYEPDEEMDIGSEEINSVKTLNSNADPTMNFPTYNFYKVESSHQSSSTMVDGSIQTAEINCGNTAYLGPQLSPKSMKSRIKLEPDDYMDINTKETQTDRSDTLIVDSGGVDKMWHYELKILSLENELKRMKNRVLPKKKQLSSDEFTKKMRELVYWKNKMKAKYKNKYHTTEFKLFALNLYVSSRHIYKTLSSALKLPSLKSLKRLKINFTSSLNDQSLKCLAYKVNSLPDNAKYCTLLIDTIDLKRHLYYNITRDEIIGLHTLSGHVTNIVASTVYYIMLRGIAFDWEQPIAYLFLANNSCFADLNDWLNDVIIKLSNLGIHIMAMTSSQEEHFVRYAAYKLVSVDKPFFMVNGQKIYYIFDAPHLLTCLRNDLIDHDFYHENQKISWSHIEALYAYKKQNLLNVLPKITDAHVSPRTSDRNELKYAAQIFSQSVFSIFDILMSINFVPKEAKPTALFIKTINDLFDILNSNKLKCDNEFKSAFTQSESQSEAMLTVHRTLKSLTAVNKATKVDVTKDITTFKSIQITAYSVLLLSDSLKELGIRHILTKNLNREPVESFKKKIKLEDCNRSKVTAIQFRRMFAKQFIRYLLPKTKHDKFQGDLAELLIKTNKSEPICCPRPRPRPRPRTENYSLASERPVSVSLYGDYDYRLKLPKRYAFTFVASYLLFKCTKKHQCPVLDGMLAQCPVLKLDENTNPTSPFSGQLKIPSVPFCKNIRVLDEMFIRVFSEVVISKPAENLMRILSKVFFPPCGCFPTKYLLTLFIRFKIYSVLIHNKNIPPCASEKVDVIALINSSCQPL